MKRREYFFLLLTRYDKRTLSVSRKYNKVQANKTVAGRYRGPFVWDFESNLQHSSVTYLALCIIFTTLHDQNYSRSLQAS